MIDLESREDVLIRMNEIAERLRSTTPGMWKACFADDERFMPDEPVDDPCIISDFGQYIAQTAYDGQSHTCRKTMYTDAEFIAHAKEDIAYLLKQLEVSLFER